MAADSSLWSVPFSKVAHHRASKEEGDKTGLLLSKQAVEYELSTHSLAALCFGFGHNFREKYI